MTFRVPESARPADIEWPPGSGRVAHYEPHERRIMRDLVRGHEAGRCSGEELRTQLGFLHELKVEFDGRFLTDEDVEAMEREERKPPRREPGIPDALYEASL